MEVKNYRFRGYKEKCKNGHNLSETRCRDKRNQTYCRQCREERYKNKAFVTNPNWPSRTKFKRNLTNLKHRCKEFGITIDDYYEIYCRQNCKCALCLSSKCSSGRNFSIDHCHKTGKVRGLLCRDCNTSLGKIKDSTDWLKRALKYLK